jgi:ribonuclease HI
MKTIIVLAMHGAPPNDFPARETAELVGLHARREAGHVAESEREALERRFAELDAKMRAWPRTAQNDPFWAGSQELAEHLEKASGCEVIVGCNEFCAPTLDDALDQAAALGSRVIVVTPMVTRGGEHSEVEIPATIQRARERHPEIEIIYAWPLDVAAIARFLAAQVAQLVPTTADEHSAGNLPQPESEPAGTQRNTGELERVTLYTDGACVGNPGPGGYGVVLLHEGQRKELSGGFRLTTNNRMEIMAAIVGLRALKERCSVTLYSDSRYLVESMTQGWAKQWRANHWRRGKRGKALNSDLWEQLLDLCDRHKVEFVWVEGHAGHRENEHCDQLSVQAAQRKDLPADSVYEEGDQSVSPTLFD